MPTLNSGQSATVTVPAGMPFRVATTSEATVSQIWQGGSPVFLDRLVGANLSKLYAANSGTQTYLITGVSGSTDYGGGYIGVANTTPEVVTSTQFDAMNAALSAGQASYPIGYSVISDGILYILSGLGGSAAFAVDGAGNSGGTLAPYWGPTTAKGSMPKVIGGWAWKYGCTVYETYDSFDTLRIPFNFAATPGEKLKALSGAYTNGLATVYASVVVGGVVYPAYGIVSLSRTESCEYGAVCVLEAQMGQRWPAGTLVYVKNYIINVRSHNDPTASLAGQHPFYASPEIGVDILCSVNAAPAAGTWEATVDSPDITAIPVGASNIGTLGFRPWTLLTRTTKRTIFIGGDSREQSGDRNGSSTNHYRVGLGGAQGESCRGYARAKIGAINAGISNETTADTLAAGGYAARAVGAEWCSNIQYGYMTNDLTIDSDLSTPATAVARLAALIASWRALMPTSTNKPLRVKTVSPRVTVSTYLTSYAGQGISSGIASGLYACLNGAIRRKTVGNSSHYEAHDYPATTSQDSGIYPIHPGARSTNTGTGTVTVDAGTGITTLVWSANIFAPDDGGKRVVIAAAGTGAAILDAQMQYVSATTVNLIRPNSDYSVTVGRPAQIAASQLNGGASPLALTGSTNILYLQAYSVGRDGIHFVEQGEDAVADANVRLGTLPLED